MSNLKGWENELEGVDSSIRKLKDKIRIKELQRQWVLRSIIKIEGLCSCCMNPHWPHCKIEEEK